MEKPSEGAAELSLTYMASLEEATDAGVRLAELNGTAARQKWLGLAVGLVLLAGLYLLIPGQAVGNLGTAVIAAALFSALHLLTWRRLLRGQVRRIMKRGIGSQPLEVSYRLAQEGLSFRRSGQEIRFDWETVAGIVLKDECIELITEPVGIAMIPRRWLIEEGVEDRWMTFIREHAVNAEIADERTGALDGDA